MMTWLFILLDILLIVILITLITAFVYFLNRVNPLKRSSLAQFRNDEIYEQSMQDKKRFAHIEDRLEDIDLPENLSQPDESDLMFDEKNIFFSPGYGGNRETGEEDAD